MSSRPEWSVASADVARKSPAALRRTASRVVSPRTAAPPPGTRISGARQHIRDSRRLMQYVSERNLYGGRRCLYRSEERISRSLTLLLESESRVYAWREAAPGTRQSAASAPAVVMRPGHDTDRVTSE